MSDQNICLGDPLAISFSDSPIIIHNGTEYSNDIDGICEMFSDAIENEDPELLVLALDNGYNPCQKYIGSGGRKPVHYIPIPELFDILVEYGADPEAEDDEYNTPLDLFKKYGHTQMIEHLRDNYGIE